MVLEASDRNNISNILVPHPKSRRVYVSTLYVGLEEVWPNFDKLPAEITIDSDYSFIGKPRGDFQALIKSCDLFLAIYGFRSEGLDEQQEKEYEVALASAKPILAFVHSLYRPESNSRAVSDLLRSSTDDRRRVVRFDPSENLTEPVIREIQRFFRERDGKNADPGPRPGPVELSPYLKNLLLQERDLAEAVPANADHSERWTAQFNAVRTLARLLNERGQIEEAAKVYYELLERFPLERDKRQELEAERDKTIAGESLRGLRAQGSGEIPSETPEELRNLLNEDLERSKKLGDEKAIANSLLELGRLAQHQKRYDEAHMRFRESLEISRKVGDESRVATALIDLGRLARRQAKHDEALRFLREGLEINQKLGNELAEANSLRELGNLALDQKQFFNAHEFFDQSLEINKKLGDERAIASSFFFLGRLASTEQKTDEARRLFNESLHLYQKLDDPQGFAAVTQELRRLAEPDEEEEGKTQGETAKDVSFLGLGHVLEQADRLSKEIRHNRTGCPVMLISLFDDVEDRATHAFLRSFGITRKQLYDVAELQGPGSGTEGNYTKTVARALGMAGRYSAAADMVLGMARQITRNKKADEILPRYLFQALLDEKENRIWLDKLISADAVGWIANTLSTWDDETPITQSAVQAKMVQDRLFANPPTQRDSAAETDLLGFEEYAEALVQIIRRPETRAPLVVGVYGPWGSGKSTFMGLVKRKLDALGQPPATQRSRVGAFIERQLSRLRGLFRKGVRSLRVTTVNYDAWAYADAQKLWAGLVDKIAKELDAELTARDRIAYLINSQSRRLVAAVALGLIPVALFALGYSGRQLPEWLSSLISPIGNKPWLNVPGWITTGVWALYAYFLQRRPLTDKVASLAASFDSAPTAGLVSRIQDEFKTALQARIDPEKKPKSVDTLRTDIRQRVERNELKIVVFIDELDRCPLEKIVEILEAIKLFLAEDIFIVLLGVDTRVAAEAIRLHYKEVRNPNLPREYLEKIVQLPLRVPTAGKTNIETYLQSFMTLPEDEIQTERQDGTAKRPALPPVSDQPSLPSSAGMATQLTQDERPPDLSAKSGVVTRTLNADENQLTTAEARTPYDVSALGRLATLPQMPDTRTEFDAMTAIASEFLDSNPRRIKRLLNTYRYVKILGARLPGSQVQTAGWQRTMLYWLAFTMKWPSFMSETIEAAEQNDPENLTDDFLVGRLQDRNQRFQPKADDIKEYLPLTAKEVLELYQLAPNFLIENPGPDRKPESQAGKSVNGSEPTEPAGSINSVVERNGTSS